MNVHIDIPFHLTDKAHLFGTIDVGQMAPVLSEVRPFEVAQLSQQMLVGYALFVEKLVEFLVFLVRHRRLGTMDKYIKWALIIQINNQMERVDYL